MEFWRLIVLFGVCWLQLTTAFTISRGSYILDINEGDLKNITVTGDSNDIDLSGLMIRNIHKNVFHDLTNLRSLSLAGNDLEKLPARIFSTLRNLEVLSLAGNKLSTFYKNFEGLQNLKTLNLSDNPIRYLNNGSLFGLSKSVEIIVARSQLVEIQADAFEAPSLRESDDNVYSDLRIEFYGSFYDVYFKRPLSGKLTVKICQTDDGLITSLEEFKPNEILDGCRSVAPNNNTSSLDLRSFGIREFQKGWYRLPNGSISRIRLSNNDITEITPELLNDLPSDLFVVDLAKNKIEIIRRNTISNRYCRTLDLRSNLISTIEDGAFENTEIYHLILMANKFKNFDFIRGLPGSIRVLAIDENDISEIPEGSLMKLKELRHLFATRINVTHIRTNAFRGLHNLLELFLDNNKLKIIESGAFEDLGKLTSLFLNSNEIRELQPGFFKGLTSLNYVDVGENKIRKIYRDSFAGLNSSQPFRIHLPDNEIDTIEEGSFANLAAQYISLGGNKISEHSIAKGAFNNTNSLRILELGENPMTRINGDSFYGLSNLYELSLRWSQIKSIEKGAAKYLESVKLLSLDRNPLERLDNGALYGLQKAGARVTLEEVPIKVIQGGLFDDL